MKLSTNGSNNSQHCWANNVASCGVLFHVAKSLTAGFKLCATTHNNMQQGVQTDATCNIQQCCVHLHTELKNEEGNWRRNASRNWFWDRYWWHARQLLAKSSLSLVTVPEVFAKVISSQFPSYFWSGELHYEWINEWKEGGGGMRMGIQKVALSQLALHVKHTFFLGRGGMIRVDTSSAKG